MNKQRLFTGANEILNHSGSRKVDGHADRLVGEETIYGPLSGQDVRMYLNRASLEHLLEVAKSSMVGRAELLGVGARVKVWESPSGHRYLTWELISQPPRAESCIFDKPPGAP